MGQTKVLGGLIEGAGTAWQEGLKTTNFTAVAGEGYFVNTTSAAITVTLPSSPTAGDELTIVDYAGTADTNNITITSSDNINGAANDLLINYERGGVSMVYVDATQGWIAYNAANETDTALNPDLVIAGGGSGGNNYAGGGGAGGYRTSYNSETSGGGASSETSLTLDPSTNYTVTVGAGGAAQSTLNTKGNSGSNSIFSTVTSIGGGFGNANVGVGGASSGGDGGSGGGGHYQTPGNVGGAGTANQGYAGGNAVSGLTPYTAGGGGGAGSVGGNGSSSSSGSGGSGVASTITGSSVTRAGGGGGGYASDVNKPAGAGGSGGGGAGGASASGAGGNGVANTGSGGGGTGGQNSGGSNSGAGGSGVVILRYPDAYTVNIGSGLTGSTATDGSDKVTTFTAGTGTISFT
jgi:hypothetical protein